MAERPVVASGFTIIKHVLAKHGPQTQKQLFSRITEYAPLANLTRHKFKKHLLNALKARNDVIVKVDHTMRHHKFPNRHEFTHRINPKLEKEFASDEVLYQDSRVLTDLKNKELEISKQFWSGESNLPYVPSWPGKKSMKEYDTSKAQPANEA
ncbi:hypothetical protein IWQ61_010277 [Dispira simplex]|nr:hypothetical protein IWQ61_010277 [Dispira simplex]